MDKAGPSKKSLMETFNRVKSKQMNELRKENEFCDVTLKCADGLEIRVHKVILCSASIYFKNLLMLPMKEKFQESIVLPYITADVLEKIITFMYTSEFEEKIKDVETIIEYAAFFQLEELLEICSLALSESFSEHIAERTCVKYWRLGKVNLIYSLEDKCLSYIAKYAYYFFETSLMSDLTIEEMKSILADNRFHLQCNEKMLFAYVWQWAKTKVSETKTVSEVFSEVVDLFNYAKLKEEFILLVINDLPENAELLQKIKQMYGAHSSHIS